jgi:hypothetical protein
MRKPRPGQEKDSNYLVLNRSCADLYEKIAEVFENQPEINVVVDRRRGTGGMTEIPSSRRRRARTRKKQANPRMVSVQIKREAS